MKLEYCFSTINYMQQVLTQTVHSGITPNQILISQRISSYYYQTLEFYSNPKHYVSLSQISFVSR